MTDNRTLRIAGIVGTIAALLGGTGDLLLFYTPGFAADMFAVQAISTGRIIAGTLLAILVIPLLPVGYWVFSRYLRRAGEMLATVVFVVGMYGAALGNAIHGTVGTLARVIQRSDAALDTAAFQADFAPFVVPIYGLFYVIMIVGSIYLAVIIWRGKTAFPRWFVVLLPLWSNVLVLPLAQVVPPLGDALIPSIANLSHALMFGVMTALFWGHESESATP